MGGTAEETLLFQKKNSVMGIAICKGCVVRGQGKGESQSQRCWRGVVKGLRSEKWGSGMDYGKDINSLGRRVAIGGRSSVCGKKGPVLAVLYVRNA